MGIHDFGYPDYRWFLVLNLLDPELPNYQKVEMDTSFETTPFSKNTSCFVNSGFSVQRVMVPCHQDFRYAKPQNSEIAYGYRPPFTPTVLAFSEFRELEVHDAVIPKSLTIPNLEL
jgi:hypothetical protein